MPKDKYGNIAHVIMEPTSIPSRMNISVLYEHYFNAFSRHTKRLVINKICQLGGCDNPSEAISALNEKQTIEVFDIVLGLLSILDTEQYYGYKELRDSSNIYNIHEILKEIVDRELYLYYKVSSKKKPMQVIEELKGTIYAPPIDSVYVYSGNNFVETVDTNILIAPMYTLLLFKTGDEFLSCASAKTNHYNFPVGSSKNNKTRLPWRNSPTRILSETETRLYASYGSRLAIAELKDRANNVESHKKVYESILTAPQPTNIDKNIDRNKHPYGGDSSLSLINSVFNSAGISIEYSPEEES